jgi:hypothetical protein
MPDITNEGTFQVQIIDAVHRATPKEEDEHAFSISLKGETPDGLHAWGTMFFSHKEIQNGKNIGRTMAEVQIETLKRLGVKDGFPGNLDAAIKDGLHAEFVMKYDEYNGETKLKCAFINPVSTAIPVKEVDYKLIMAKFNGEKVEEEPKTPTNEPLPKVEMPNSQDEPDNSAAPPEGEIPF